jgi:2-methylcitrate dehydratase PrpD
LRRQAPKTRQSDLTIALKDGRQLTLHVENAIGSAENPMNDAALEAKFTGLADGVLPQACIRHLIALCWVVERAPDMAAIARAASA